MKSLWQNSHSVVKPELQDTTWLLRTWWTLWLISSVLGQGELRASLRAEPASELTNLAFITIAKSNGAGAPAATFGAAGKSAVGGYELVIGIRFPMGRFKTASNDDAGTIAVSARFHRDGGGKVHAARRTVYGSRRLTNLFTVVTRKGKGRLTAQLVTINGETGILEFVDGKPFAVSAFTIEEGKVTEIYRVMNPDKLRSFADVPQTFPGDLLSQTNDIGRLS
jgi:hypothetical protein